MLSGKQGLESSRILHEFRTYFCLTFLFNWTLFAGIKAQVAIAEQVSTEAVQKVESPVVIVTGASRGIGKAVALALGKAGCKVGLFTSICHKFSLKNLTSDLSNIYITPIDYLSNIC